MQNISVVILAGGKSSRMGTDKGFVDFAGKKMIEHVLLKVKPLTNEILIVSNNHEYKKFGYPVFEDIYKNCGPLGGIHSGLRNSKPGWILVIGCDLPFITSDFLFFLLEKVKEATTPSIVPVHNNKVEPLCAFYHTDCLREIENMILNREYKMQTVVQKLYATFVEVAKEKFNALELFRNMNYPADLVTSDH